MNQVRRKFDDNFKREAVNHWLTSGKPASQVSKELGISNANLLYNWKQRFAPDDAGGRAAAGAKPAPLPRPPRAWRLPNGRSPVCASNATF
jgi:transposase-like protein